MKLSIKYIDNNINISNEMVNVLEIENKELFNRFINELNNIANGDVEENISFFEDDYEEINLSNKINIIFDYFNLELNSKKLQGVINKKINENIEITERDELVKLYEKIKKIVTPVICNLDLKLEIKNDFDVDTMIKLLNISVQKSVSILDNLLTLIDIEKTLRINKLLIFVNLKSYLSKEELLELLKYSLYNDVSILLIDSHTYGTCNKLEKKLLIDNNLEEYVI